MRPMRCYAHALIPLIYAVARVAGFTSEIWLIVFLVAEAVALLLYADEVRHRFQQEYEWRHR